MGLAEYFIHKKFMHTRFFKKDGKLDWIFKDHAIEHHKNERYDINIDLPMTFHLIIGAPLLIALFFISKIGLIIMLLVMLHHSIVWSKIHRLAHDLEDNIFKYYPNYSKLKEHHLKHHDYPNKNYGVVYTWTDKFFGTKI